ncbi:NAD(P)H-dependent oxidoreductase [Carnobacteriaceae bacterium zg-ZUI78]|nr:NAD(P)H-dependent oxidoreductase [Carnobacteriaceae bacterium zg-ZUI78]
MSRKSILMVVGSTRQQSYNQALAEYIAAQLQEHADVSFLDYKDVPILEQDAEFPTPASVVRTRETVAKADGVWVVTPEYNHAYPAIVKNLFDWLSRASEAGSQEPTVIAGKPITFSGAGGSTEAFYVREQLGIYLKKIRMNTMDDTGVGIALPMESWVTGQLILSDEQKAALNEQVKQFVEFVNA